MNGTTNEAAMSFRIYKSEKTALLRIRASCLQKTAEEYNQARWGLQLPRRRCVAQIFPRASPEQQASSITTDSMSVQSPAPISATSIERSRALHRKV